MQKETQTQRYTQRKRDTYVVKVLELVRATGALNDAAIVVLPCDRVDANRSGGGGANVLEHLGLILGLSHIGPARACQVPYARRVNPPRYTHTRAHTHIHTQTNTDTRQTQDRHRHRHRQRHTQTHTHTNTHTHTHKRSAPALDDGADVALLEVALLVRGLVRIWQSARSDCAIRCTRH